MARERELFARQRAAELAKANEALRGCLDALASVPELDDLERQNPGIPLIKGMTPEVAIAPMWWPGLRPAAGGVDQSLSLVFTEIGRDKITHWIIFAGETHRL